MPIDALDIVAFLATRARVDRLATKRILTPRCRQATQQCNHTDYAGSYHVSVRSASVRCTLASYARPQTRTLVNCYNLSAAASCRNARVLLSRHCASAIYRLTHNVSLFCFVPLGVFTLGVCSGRGEYTVRWPECTCVRKSVENRTMSQHLSANIGKHNIE